MTEVLQHGRDPVKASEIGHEAGQPAQEEGSLFAAHGVQGEQKWDQANPDERVDAGVRERQEREAAGRQGGDPREGAASSFFF